MKPGPATHALLALTLLCLAPLPAQARRYPITVSDGSGTWVGTRQGLLHASGELWKRYGKAEGLPADEVTDVELDTRSVWVATTAGLARLDKGSRRWETFAAPALPSSSVTSVSADPSDPDQVWVGTLGGLAQYNVRTNTWTRWGRGSGLPSERVHDVLFRGQTVWVGSDAGLTAFDVGVRTWTRYSKSDGLAGEHVLEIDEVGPDLWLTCEAGLTRMSVQRRTFAAFRKQEGMPGSVLQALTRVQNLMYFITDGGLITYDTSTDSLTPFLHLKGLQSARVRSVTSAGGYIWFATDQGLARFEPIKKVWERYRTEDGLSTDDLRQITVAGSFLMVFGAKGELDSYDYKKDEWVDRAGLVKATSILEGGADGTPRAGPSSAPSSQPAASGPVVTDQKVKLSISAELNTELKQDVRLAPRDNDWSSFDTTREGYWLVNTLRLGAGAGWASGRTLDFSGNLDWGDVSPVFDQSYATLKSFQRYDFQLRYLGSETDWVREVIGSDKLRLEPDAGRLLERTELEGGRVVLTAGPARRGGRFATIQATAGVRRGTPMRVVLRRADVDSLKIKRFKLLKQTEGGGTKEVRYVIASSVRALLDGRELERNVDYFVDHENGVLWLKSTDLMHSLRTLEVELEYEQIGRKNVGAVSMTDLLPRDGDIGKIKRSGPSRWAKDEQGLFDEIDGGAEQYINRGWVTTLSQDFEWGSAGIILRIHDMGDDKNARSVFLARKLPDAKPVPGMEDVFLEKQAASLSIKLTRGQFFIEVSIDQATMEQEILSLAEWLASKLSASGSTSADALRDLTLSAMGSLRFTDNASVGLSYLGVRSVDNEDVKRLYHAIGHARDLWAMNAAYSRRLTKAMSLAADFQAAASSASEDGTSRISGNGLQGSAQLSSSSALVRLAARKYSAGYSGIGVARQTEFCRAADGDCTRPGASQMDYELGVDATVKPASWLPVALAMQRQTTNLGWDYADAPETRSRTGVRDLASAQVSLDKSALPKVTLGGAYLRRNDALTEQGQLRGTGGLEADLADTWLRALKFKKIFLRGLYEIGKNEVDEFRAAAADERDRTETMQHAVAEVRLAPTLTESAYSTLEYHSLRGTLASDSAIADLLTYWRLDSGAGTSIVPGLALRFDSTLWFGDDQPPLAADSTGLATEVHRNQQADSTLSGVMDLFPGEWLKRLSPIKLNAAYTYTQQTQSQGVRRVDSTGVIAQKEQCQNGIDDDHDSLTDCDDPECALSDACLLRTGQLKSHRIYGTLYWDTPGKLQIELFGDYRRSYSDRDDILRSNRLEVRSYVTWRPIYSSPVTLRFDVMREVKKPDTYDALSYPVEPEVATYEPGLEWRRRWSPKWWHLAKVTVSHSRTRGAPHVRTLENAYGRKGDLERLDYNDWALKPSVEIRRRYEDESSTWNFRPYARLSYKLQWGSGLSSRIEDRSWAAGDAGMTDGSETSRTLALSLGFIWVHSEHIFVDLDVTTSYFDCVRAPTGSFCQDTVTVSPHLLATARY